MTRLELAIAWRYLRSRRGSRLLSLISVIAIAGVLVGVSALIVIIGVMNGLQKDLRDKILTGSPDIRVLSYGEDLKILDWSQVLEKVRRQRGVVAADPFVLTQGLVSTGHDYAEGAYVMGIMPRDSGSPQNVTEIRAHAVKGQGDFRFIASNGRPEGAMVGKLLASRLNIARGDTITIVSPAGAKMNAALGTFIPRMKQYEVTGTFETGMFEYDNAYIYLPFHAAQDFAGLGSAATGIEVKTADRWKANLLGPALDDALGFPYRTMTWQEQNRSLFQALKLEKLAMAVILLLIVVVAAFNIVSTLTMVVADKTREIGILKAMGMPARSIHRIFFVQGVVIGLVGTVLGVVAGLGAAGILHRYKVIALDPQVYFIDRLPVATQPGDVLLIVLASLLIAAVATLYPAKQAARLYPIEAIRHD